MNKPQSVESIQQAALDLQPEARLQLTHALVESAQIEQLWLTEAESRDAEMESGHVEEVSAVTLLRRIRDRWA